MAKHLNRKFTGLQRPTACRVKPGQQINWHGTWLTITAEPRFWMLSAPKCLYVSIPIAEHYRAKSDSFGPTELSIPAHFPVSIRQERAHEHLTHS